jgi:hypothetical protein
MTEEIHVRFTSSECAYRFAQRSDGTIEFWVPTFLGRLRWRLHFWRAGIRAVVRKP